MPESHEVAHFPSQPEVALRQFLRQRRAAPPGGDFETFERELHALVVVLERDLLAEELARYDVEMPRVTVRGKVYRRTAKSTETYTTAAGPVIVSRHLYHPVDGDGEAICPMALRAGVVEGTWTPRAARQMALVVSHLTPADAEGLFAELGNMTPSRSSLERLPKALSECWEDKRVEWEALLREQETPAAGTAVIALSLDGVLTPMKDGKRAEKRMSSLKRAKGPAGYKEAAVGTVTCYDKDVERLDTIRYARMPESKKPTLHSQLAAEFAHQHALAPLATVVKLADAAAENWRILRAISPEGVEIADFFHACEHLKKGLDAHLGEGSAESRAVFAQYRVSLRDDEDGVERVIRTLLYRSKTTKGSKRKRIDTELNYFRKHKKKMRYAEFTKMGLPIGSGVVEAACKTLVTQRLKRSGMRWSVPGGQAILTLRSLFQSNRWERGWVLIAASYVVPVLSATSSRRKQVRAAITA